MRRRLLRHLILLGVMPLLLAGCGFSLRQPVNYAFTSLYCDLASNSPMGIEVQRQLLSSGELRYITDSAQLKDAQVLLDVYGEKRVKTVVGVTATGEVREYQLRLTMKFRLRTQLGRELIPETELMQQRTMSYSEAYALAKEVEENMLYRDMQRDVAQQIMRRLAAIREL